VNVPDVRDKRRNWVENLPDYAEEKLVFLDESGINTNMTRIYGRSPGGTRSVDKAPLNTPNLWDCYSLSDLHFSKAIGLYRINNVYRKI